MTTRTRSATAGANTAASVDDESTAVDDVVRGSMTTRTRSATAGANTAASVDDESMAVDDVVSTVALRRRRASSTPPSWKISSVQPTSAFGRWRPPAFFPFQLTDEMYARILRDPAGFGYPELPVGSMRDPKFGWIFVETRHPTDRRPKLVDGLDWVPSSTQNASSRMLRDGKTELMRFYCARRTKAALAAPLEKPFFIFQRSMTPEIKASLGGSPTSYELKKALGKAWAEMPPARKAVFQAEAFAKNRLVRQRMAAADPAELLVRHEMYLREVGRDEADIKRVLVHYLGDTAFQQLSLPPRPMRVARSDARGAGPSGVLSGARSGGCDEGGGGEGGGDEGGGDEGGDDEGGEDGETEHAAYTIASDVETRDVQLFLGSSGIVCAAALDAWSDSGSTSARCSSDGGHSDGVEDSAEEDEEGEDERCGGECGGGCGSGRGRRPLPPLGAYSATAAVRATSSSTSSSRRTACETASQPLLSLRPPPSRPPRSPSRSRAHPPARPPLRERQPLDDLAASATAAAACAAAPSSPLVDPSAWLFGASGGGSPCGGSLEARASRLSQWTAPRSSIFDGELSMATPPLRAVSSALSRNGGSRGGGPRDEHRGGGSQGRSPPSRPRGGGDVEADDDGGIGTDRSRSHERDEDEDEDHQGPNPPTRRSSSARMSPLGHEWFELFGADDAQMLPPADEFAC